MTTPLQRPPGERRGSAFGLVITSPHAFVGRLGASDAAPDLFVRPVTRSPLGEGWQQTAAAYRSPVMLDAAQSFLDIVPLPGGTVFHYSEVLDFFVLPRGIAYRLLDEAYAFMFEPHLLGAVMAYWLERAGWPALHASAVTVGERAIGFVSHHGGGKTSLAGTFLAAGQPLLSDDVLALTFDAAGRVMARPGYPQMRMWRDLALWFVGHDDLETVHPRTGKCRVPIGPSGWGTFDPAARPLAALYLPDRTADVDTVRIEPVGPAEAVFELVRRSYLTSIVEALGMATGRLAAIARAVRSVPVRRLRFPAGLDRLPEVHAAVIADLAALDAASSPTDHLDRP